MTVQSGIETFRQTIGQVFQADTSYMVPAHQRDFAWRPQEEVKQLWDDLMDAMDQGRNDYFLGTIVVVQKPGEKIRAVIDGQQRLAVLSMLLATVRSAYLEYDDPERALEVYNDYLGVRDRRSRLTEPKLTLNITNKQIFRDQVIEHVDKADIEQTLRDKSLAPSSSLLLQSLFLIRELVAQRVKASTTFDTFLLDLEFFIKDSAFLILVTVENDADAYLIFETLNDRGLDLSISDLLKNYVYSRAGARLSEVQQQWEEMTFLLGSQDVTQFLRHYWLSKYGVVRERELYRSLRAKFSSPQRVLTLMAELRGAADKYAAMSNVDNSLWTGYSTQFRRDFETLQLFGLSQFRPLLLAALDKLDQHEIENIVHLVVVISMRYTIVGALATSTIERAYSDVAIKIREGSANSWPKIFSLLKKGDIYPDDARFASDFSSKTVNKAKLARYILTELANEIQPSEEREIIRDEQRVTLEHIMPKTRSKDWLHAAQDQDQYVEYVDRLGNLTLIERTANQAAGNASFEEKKNKAFSKSDIVLTSGLCQYSDWTVAEIDDRQSKLATIAAKVWSIQV